MSYNSKTKSLCPSDGKFTILTMLAIIVPAGLSFYVIWFCDSEKIDFITKIILSSIYGFFLFLSVFYFCMTAFSDPGILPSIYMNSDIPCTEKKKADNLKAYYVDY